MSTETNDRDDGFSKQNFKLLEMFKDLKDNNMNIIKNIYPPPTHKRSGNSRDDIYSI